MGSIPESGISPGEGNGNSPQYSYLGNPINREAYWVTVQGVTKSWTQLTSRLYDPAIPLWACIWIKLIQKETCTPKFIAALFAKAETWKQPKCPPADEKINKIWYIYLFSVCVCVCVCVCIREYFSTKKRMK